MGGFTSLFGFFYSYLGEVGNSSFNLASVTLLQTICVITTVIG